MGTFLNSLDTRSWICLSQVPCSAGVPPAVRRASRLPLSAKTAGRCPPLGRAGRRRYKKLMCILACQLSILGSMPTFALTELLGTPVFDTAGSRCGRVREVALIPQEDRARVAMLIVTTGTGNRLLPFPAVTSRDAGIRTDSPPAGWAVTDGSEGMLLLGRDLLDQQVIDGFGPREGRVH